MKEPLNQFADRIIDNAEVEEFIVGLIEKGVSPQEIKRIVTQAEERSRKFWDHDPPHRCRR